MNGYWMGASALTFNPEGPLTGDGKSADNGAAGSPLPWPMGPLSRADAAVWLAGYLGLV